MRLKKKEPKKIVYKTSYNKLKFSAIPTYFSVLYYEKCSVYYEIFYFHKLSIMYFFIYKNEICNKFRKNTF
jgi:hypothetical protein